MPYQPAGWRTNATCGVDQAKPAAANGADSGKMGTNPTFPHQHVAQSNSYHAIQPHPQQQHNSNSTMASSKSINNLDDPGGLMENPELIEKLFPKCRPKTKPVAADPVAPAPPETSKTSGVIHQTKRIWNFMSMSPSPSPPPLSPMATDDFRPLPLGKASVSQDRKPSLMGDLGPDKTRPRRAEVTAKFRLDSLLLSPPEEKPNSAIETEFGIHPPPPPHHHHLSRQTHSRKSFDYDQEDEDDDVLFSRPSYTSTGRSVNGNKPAGCQDQDGGGNEDHQPASGPMMVLARDHQMVLAAGKEIFSSSRSARSKKRSSSFNSQRQQSSASEVTTALGYHKNNNNGNRVRSIPQRLVAGSLDDDHLATTTTTTTTPTVETTRVASQQHQSHRKTELDPEPGDVDDDDAKRIGQCAREPNSDSSLATMAERHCSDISDDPICATIPLQSQEFGTDDQPEPKDDGVCSADSVYQRFATDLKKKLSVVSQNTFIGEPEDEVELRSESSGGRSSVSSSKASVFDAPGIARLIGSVPIAQYEGSPKRYGPKPGYPKRVISSTAAATAGASGEHLSSENGSPNSSITSATFSSTDVHSSTSTASFSCPSNSMMMMMKPSASANHHHHSSEQWKPSSKPFDSSQLPQISCDEVIKSLLNIPAASAGVNLDSETTTTDEAISVSGDKTSSLLSKFLEDPKTASPAPTVLELGQDYHHRCSETASRHPDKDQSANFKSTSGCESSSLSLQSVTSMKSHIGEAKTPEPAASAAYANIRSSLNSGTFSKTSFESTDSSNDSNHPHRYHQVAVSVKHHHNQPNLYHQQQQTTAAPPPPPPPRHHHFPKLNYVLCLSPTEMVANGASKDPMAPSDSVSAGGESAFFDIPPGTMPGTAAVDDVSSTTGTGTVTMPVLEDGLSSGLPSSDEMMDYDDDEEEDADEENITLDCDTGAAPAAAGNSSNYVHNCGSGGARTVIGCESSSSGASFKHAQALNGDDYHHHYKYSTKLNDFSGYHQEHTPPMITIKPGAGSEKSATYSQYNHHHSSIDVDRPDVSDGSPGGQPHKHDHKYCVSSSARPGTANHVSRAGKQQSSVGGTANQYQHSSYHHFYHHPAANAQAAPEPNYPNLSSSPTQQSQQLLSSNSPIGGGQPAASSAATSSSASSASSSHQQKLSASGVPPTSQPEMKPIDGGCGDNSSSVAEDVGAPGTTGRGGAHHDEDCDTDQETDRLLGAQRNEERGYYDEKGHGLQAKRSSTSREVRRRLEPEVLIEGVLFRARYLGSTQLVCDGQPTKATRMMQAEEAVSRIKSLAPEGESQPSTEVDLFISTEKIMVLNTDLKEIMMDHALRTISYIADIGDLLVLMARRRSQLDEQQQSQQQQQSEPGGGNLKRTPKMICHVFESEEAQYIAQSIGQAFQVAYMEFLKANGIKDSSFLKEMDYQEVLNSQEIFGDELEMFSKREKQKEVIVPKQKGEILGIVIVESGWGSMLPTVVIANLAQNSPSARCGQLNIGDQIIAINGISLVGLPLSTCQNYVKNTKNQTAVKFTIVPCPPVVEVKIKRPDTKYQLGFSVQNGVICSLLRGGIAERGGVRVGHRIIEINGQSVVAVPHDRIVNLLATSVGEIHMKTMPTSMFRLLTGQEAPSFM